MKQSVILTLICVYLVGIPIISSANGLSMHLTGISIIGPIYHTVFSLILIAVGVTSNQVQKSWALVLAASALILNFIGLQCALGLSDFALGDLGHLYKWLMPILLLAVYHRWRYLSTPTAQDQLARAFRNIPLIYSGLIFLSLLAYLVFGFNPTLFDGAARLRFVGFAWGYNTTVNTFFICAYVNLILLRTPPWMKLVYGAAFLLLLSKTAVVYFSLLAFSFVKPYLTKKPFGSRLLAGVVASPLLAGALWFGFNQTVRSADLYQGAARRDLTTTELLSGALASTRLDFWQYVIEDVPTWPTVNLLLGNGTNVDRRVQSRLWWALIGRRYYTGLTVDKSTKALELDLLGHLDMFGIVGASIFAALFYVYPIFAIRLPLFRPYLLFLIILSLFGGHLINNPHTASPFVFLLLFLRNKPRESIAVSHPEQPAY